MLRGIRRRGACRRRDLAHRGLAVLVEDADDLQPGGVTQQREPPSDVLDERVRDNGHARTRRSAWHASRTSAVRDAAARRDLALTRLNVTPQTSSSPSPQASYHTASAPPVPWPSSTRPSADGRHWRLPAHQRSLAIWRVCASLLQGLLPVATALGLAAIMTPWRRGIHRRCRRGYRVVHGPIRCRGLFGGRARAGAARRAGTRRGRLAAASHHSRRGGGRGAVCPVG